MICIAPRSGTESGCSPFLRAMGCHYLRCAT